MKKNIDKYKFILPITVFFMLTISYLPLSNSATEVFSSGQSVIPCGIPVGIAVYSKGVLITGTASVKNLNGEETDTSKQSGLKKGDVILNVNGAEVNTTTELSQVIAASESSVNITAVRCGHVFNTSVTPVETSDGKKAGLWVRDSTAGIGTLTWYNPDTKEFAALGHGISDADTGSMFSIRGGDMFSCSITGVIKGSKGMPGELNGVFRDNPIGNISINSGSGICGRLISDDIVKDMKTVRIADENEICEGGAYMICDVDGSGPQTYGISLLKVDRNNADGKNFVIKVTDQSLIEKTGGIVQGMSGAPIIQNEMLIGAVTHVFINNPTKGYGICVSEMNK